MGKKQKVKEPTNDKCLINTDVEKVMEIGLERLRPFQNHPFKVKEDEEMYQLKDSIEKYGIMNPLIVMPTKEGNYQIISGHRRKYCAELLGYKKVPVIIRYMKEEDSIISMVDSNLHRDKLLYSEKAFAYQMKNEAMKRKGGKKRKSYGQIKRSKTSSLLGNESGDSPRQVLRYIKLTQLVPELLAMLDAGRISFNPAVDIAFLEDEEQYWIIDAMEYTQAVPSVSQARRIKILSQEKRLTKDKIIQILGEIKKGEVSRVTFKNSQIYKFFPKEYGAEQIKAEILKLLEQTYGNQGGEK